MARRKYTNTPGSASTFLTSGSSNTAPAQKQNRYTITNSSWTPEETARFNAPVQRPTAQIDRFAARRLAGPVTAFAGPVTAFRGPQQQQKELKWQDFVASDDVAGTRQTNAMRRMREFMKARAMETSANANMLSAQNQPLLQGMRNEGQLASTRLTGQNRLAVAKQRGRNQLATTGLAGRNQLAITRLTGQNQMDLANLRNQSKAEQDRFNAAIRLMGQGVPGEQVDMLAGTPGWASPTLSGINVPQKAPEQPVVKPQFVKPQFDKKNNLLPGTGIWVQPPEQGGMQQGSSLLDRYRTGKFDPNNLTPDDEIELTALAKNNPTAYQQLLAELWATAAQ